MFEMLGLIAFLCIMVVAEMVTYDTFYRKYYLPFIVFSEKHVKRVDVPYRVHEALTRSNKALWVLMTANLAGGVAVYQFYSTNIIFGILLAYKIGFLLMSASIAMRAARNVFGLDSKITCTHKRRQLINYFDAKFEMHPGCDVSVRYILGQLRFTHLLAIVSFNAIFIYAIVSLKPFG